MTRTLKSYFDKVVCCNLAERPDRRYFVEEQYRRLFGNVDIEFHTSVRHPMTDYYAAAFTQGFEGKYGRFSTGAELAYLHEHYTIIKKAYLENVNSILILEDDICFHKDVNFLYQFLDNIPGSWDVLHGDYYSSDYQTEDFVNPMMTVWKQHPSHGFWNCSFLGLSRRGMEFALSIFEKYSAPADYPYWCSVLYPELVKVYASSQPLVIQTPKEDSDIAVIKENVLPNYLYSKVNRDNHFSFSEIVPSELIEKAKVLGSRTPALKDLAPLKQPL